ncbi:MAG TPA: ABC transporter ATP-binding protein, partial [Burkholderiales bacterium]|nr:ABC transporter ATP-binding protein [Burkholderiales bacterium]
MTAQRGAAAVSVRALSKSFGPVRAVREVEFAVAPGEVFGLVGPDGAGKTTIMRMLAGVLRPDAGEIEVDGVDAGAEPELAKLRLSYMPQRFGLYEDLTVAENIRFYGELFAVSPAERAQRSRELLDAAGLAPFLRRLAGQLSGGMKQKLGLICALIHTPRVLLLDEPTTGVDPVSRRE